MKHAKPYLAVLGISALLLFSCSDDDGVECPEGATARDFSDTTCVQDCREPVCGCDNQTYCNACFAGKAGVAVAYPFPCGQERRL